MTSRWFRGAESDRHRGRERDDFDAVAEGALHGLAPDVSLAIWAHVCREATDVYGRFDEDHARRRFHEVAARAAARGGRLRPDPGKVTLIEAETSPRHDLDVFADISPGKVTRVEAEMRRCGRRAGTTQQEAPPYAREVDALLAAMSPEAREASRPMPSLAGALGLDEPEAMLPLAASQPVDVPHRSTMESIFGASFADVAAYVGEDAALAPHGARGAAWANTIVFASAAPAPDVVAHELAHVQQVRQAGGDAVPQRPWSVAWDPAEVEADQVAHAVARGATSARVAARPAAAVSFSPNTGPGGTGIPAPQLGDVVANALDDAQTWKKPFDRMLLAQAPLAPAVRAGLGDLEAHSDDVIRALGTGARRIGAVPVAPDLAGQATRPTITFDRFLEIVGETFISPELAEHGLPSSFGNAIALAPVIEEIRGAFEDAVMGAGDALRGHAGVPAGSDQARRLITSAVDTAVAARLPTIEAALASVVESWKDPLDLLELELQGAIKHLIALRNDLQQDASVGPEISRLARYILLLSRHLGPIQERVERHKQRGTLPIDATRSTAPDLAMISGTLAELRGVAAGTEADAITTAGDSAELLAVQGAGAVDPETGAQFTTEIQPEEAFPAATDALALNAQRDIVARLAAQEAELNKLKDKVAPVVDSVKKFREVYGTWFSFFSMEERDQNFGYQFFKGLYQTVMPAMSEAGWRGWVFNAGAMYAGSSVYLGGPSESAVDAISNAQVGHRYQVNDSALAPNYRFAAVAGAGSAGADHEDEVTSRTNWRREEENNRRKQVGQVYGAKPDERGRTAVETGLVPGDPASPPRLRTWRDDDYTGSHHVGKRLTGMLYDRNDPNRGLNYMLPALVMNQIGKIEVVYEHKVMREEAVEYLLALSQHHETFLRHGATADNTTTGPALGDQRSRSTGFETSEVKSTATYGPRDEHGNAYTGHAEESERLRAQIQAHRERTFAGTAQSTTTPGTDTPMEHGYRQLVAAIEQRLDEYFANGGTMNRLGAIVQIAASEYDLQEEIWSRFTPEALWEMAKYTLKLAALFFALERMGVVGKAAAEIIRQYLKWKHARTHLNLLITFAVWAEQAIQISSFDQARHWAFPFVGLAASVAEALADWIEDKLGDRLGKKWSDWKEGDKAEPRTVRELREDLDPYLADPNARAELVAKLESKLPDHKPGDPLSPEQAEAWAMLNAVDPKAAKKLRKQFPDLPELHDGSPLGVDPTQSIHTPISQQGKEAEARGIIEDELAKIGPGVIAEYRIEVLEPGPFADRFRSHRGRAAVSVVEGDMPVIYVRADATRADIADEAIHVAQMHDPRNPRLGESIRMLSNAQLGGWDKLDTSQRRDLFLRKMEVEIDAKLQAFLRAAPNTPEWNKAAADLTNLGAMRDHAAGITEAQLAALDAAPGQRPDYLDDPSWLFAKETAHDGVKLDPVAVDFATLPRTTVDDSPAGKHGKVKQIGEPWAETTTITATSEGPVTVTETKNGYVISVGGRQHAVEAGAKIHVSDGMTAKPGQPLATEPTQRFRWVEVDGKEQRLEEYSSKRRMWVKAGQDSSFKGRVAETASKQELRADLDKRGVKYAAIPHQSKKGDGFDDVIVEFHGNPPTSATIRIIEVKDYPNRDTVPLATMTAIRPEANLRTNLDNLRKQIRDARRSPPAWAKDMKDAHWDALEAAINENNYRFEIRLGPTTNMAKEGNRPGTVLEKLRQELHDEFRKDVLADTPSHIKQETVDAVIEKERQPQAGASP